MTTALVSPSGLPALPDALARQLRIRQHRLEAGVPVDLEYHPAAAAMAANLRAQLEPTTYAVVRRWLNDLASAAAVLPRDVSIDALAGGIAAACSDFPATVWNANTLRLALQTFEWLRSPAQVYKLLKPEADKLTAVVEGLEAIAKAPPALVARPAAEYKLPSVPDWVGARRGRGDHSRPALNIQPPVRSIAEQVALLQRAS